MAKLYLLRHLKSQWNKDDRFAGWVDNPLSDEGRAQAKEIAEKLAGVTFDVGYCGSLMRVTETVVRVFEYMPERYPLFMHQDGSRMQTWGNFTGGDPAALPFYVFGDLNERYYGGIQGLNKKETAQKYGNDVVHLWRRGYTTVPPGGESMADTYVRVVPVFEKYILKDLEHGKNVLVAASGNSLRAIVKHIEHISDEDVVNLELPFGALVEYEFDGVVFKPKLQ